MRIVCILISSIFSYSIIMSQVHSEPKYRLNLQPAEYLNVEYSCIDLSIDPANSSLLRNTVCSGSNSNNISVNEGSSKTQVIKEIGVADNDSSLSYSIVGITYGYPGKINAFYVYQAEENYNLRLEIGYFPDLFGYEADIGYNLYSNHFFGTNIGVGFGITSLASGDETKALPFMAFKANVTLIALFIELGYCYISDDIDKIERVYFQIGCAFRI